MLAYADTESERITDNERGREQHGTGKLMWSKPGLGRSTLLYVDDHLIVLTEHGRLLVIEPSPEAFEVVSDFTPRGPDAKLALEFPAWNAPVLSRGILYVWQGPAPRSRPASSFVAHCYPRIPDRRSYHVSQRTTVAACLLSAAFGVDVLAQPAPQEPDTFLRKHIGFARKDLDAVHGGEVVTKVLKTKEGSEIAVFGIARVETNLPTFFEIVKQVEAYQSENITKIGGISTPPVAADFNSLAFPAADVESFRKCRPGKCDIKVAAPTMERLKREVDWKAPNPGVRLNGIVRGMALSYMTAYMKGGNKALAVYHDKKKPLAAAEALEGVLQQSPYMVEYLPDLFRYMREYPDYPLDSVTDVFYWAEESFGLKPTITLNHAVVHEPPEGDSGMVIVKQLYASHYFQATVNLVALVKDTGAGAGETHYLLRLDRSRADGLGGMFGGVKRGKIEGQLDGHIEAWLTAARQALAR